MLPDLPPGQGSGAPGPFFTRWRRAAPALAALLWLAAAGWGLGSYPLAEPDEGRNGTAALEVATEGRWLLPTYDGLEYLDKPLLWFDAAALSIRAVGAGELAVRLPSLVFTAATILLLAWFSRRLYGAGAAWLAAVVWATSPLVLAYARIAIFDAMLTFFLVLALMLFYEAIEAKAGDGAGGASSRRYAALAWGAVALGILTKGPVALVVPLMVVLPYALWRRRAAALWSWVGVGGLAVVVAAWVTYVASRVPGYLEYVAITETWGRLGSTELGNTSPVWTFLPVLIGGALPWSVVAAWSWIPRRGRRPTAPDAHSSTRPLVFLVLWLVVPTLFFSFAQPKRLQYMLPVVPAIALLLAAAAAKRTVTPGALRAGAATLMVPGGALLAAGAGAWDVLAKLEEGVAAPARAAALALGLLFLLAPAAGAWLARRRPTAATLALALPGLLLPVVVFPVLVRVSEVRSSRDLAREITARCPDAPVVGVEATPTSLPFYLGRPIGLASNTGRPFGSHYVEVHWDSIAVGGDGEPLFTRSWWDDLPQRAVVVFKGRDQAQSLGAELQGFELLASGRVYAAWGRGCG